MSKRQFDVVLLGATGYTGQLCAEYITSSLPTNLKWAVAGRSTSKLQSLVSSLKKINADRTAPEVLTVEVTKSDMDTLAKKTRVLINMVGPYYLFSTPVVEACANAGTHYLDATGETVWVKEILVKYEKTAKAKGAIIIPEMGIESVPSDIVAYTATSLVRRVWDCGVMDMICAIHEIRSGGSSGGTLNTGLGLMDHYPRKAIKDSFKNPFILSPSEFRPEPTTYSRTGLEKLTGVWSYPELGLLTTSLSAPPNVAIVHRSAGLTPLLYGFNFTYEEYMSTSSTILGVLIHFAVLMMTFLLAFPPVRMVAKMMVRAPGSGPSPSETAHDALELRGVAVAEQLGKPRKALSTFRYEGGLYKLTGIFMAEAAMVLLDSADEVLHAHGPGFLTPSCLGDVYVEKLKAAGCKINVKQIGEIGSK